MPVLKTIIKKTIGVFKSPKRIAQLSAKAKNVVQMMTGNANFPLPYPANIPALATVSADITALDTAQTAALSRTKGTADARDVKKSVVVNDMHALLRYVQGVADNNPANAEAIINGSGFSVKQTGQRVKPLFQANNAAVNGSVLLRAKAAGKRASYKWGISTDQITWKDLPSTLVAKTTVSGLTAGTIYYFRFLTVTKDGESSWSQIVSVVAM